MARKLDALAELSAVGPVLHACVVGFAVTVAALLRPPGWAGIALALGISLLRPFIYTGVALSRDPEPARAVRAFAFLPFYAAWRVYNALTGVAFAGSGGQPWVRTARGEPAQSEVHPRR